MRVAAAITVFVALVALSEISGLLGAEARQSVLSVCFVVCPLAILYIGLAWGRERYDPDPHYYAPPPAVRVVRPEPPAQPVLVAERTTTTTTVTERVYLVTPNAPPQRHELPAACIVPHARQALPAPQTIDGISYPVRQALPGPGVPAAARERRFQVVGEREEWLDDW
jgi:hypothetical protein